MKKLILLAPIVFLTAPQGVMASSCEIRLKDKCPGICKARGYSDWSFEKSKCLGGYQYQCACR